MVPIVSVVGRSNTGKTYVLERLVPLLTARGYRIATVKHDVHGFDIDREGKDSWRHKQAGASTVVLSSAEKVAIIADVQRELSPEEIGCRWIQGVDLILTEGYKRALFPKIEVRLFGEPGDLLCAGEDLLIAVVSREPLAVGVPVFRESELSGLADLVEARFLKPPRREPVQVLRGGRPAQVGVFRKRVAGWVLRTLSPLLGSGSPEEDLEVRISGRRTGREGRQ